MSGPLYIFNSNVPQASQYRKQTQQPILNNFLSINEWVNVNHVGFSDPTNYGKHTYTSVLFQNSDPSTTSSEMALYSKSTPTGTNSGEIFYRYPNNGDIVQLTGGGTGSASATNGWSYLPTGIIMKWGQATGITTGNNVITFPTTDGFPAFTTQINVVTFNPVTTYTESSPCPYISATSLTSFTLTVPNTFSSTVQWLAIGV